MASTACADTKATKRRRIAPSSLAEPSGVDSDMDLGTDADHKASPWIKAGMAPNVDDLVKSPDLCLGPFVLIAGGPACSGPPLCFLVAWMQLCRKGRIWSYWGSFMFARRVMLPDSVSWDELDRHNKTAANLGIELDGCVKPHGRVLCLATIASAMGLHEARPDNEPAFRDPVRSWLCYADLSLTRRLENPFQMMAEQAAVEVNWKRSRQSHIEMEPAEKMSVILRRLACQYSVWAAAPWQRAPTKHQRKLAGIERCITRHGNLGPAERVKMRRRSIAPRWDQISGDGSSSIADNCEQACPSGNKHRADVGHARPRRKSIKAESAKVSLPQPDSDAQHKAEQGAAKYKAAIDELAGSATRRKRKSSSGKDGDAGRKKSSTRRASICADGSKVAVDKSANSRTPTAGSSEHSPTDSGQRSVLPKRVRRRTPAGETLARESSRSRPDRSTEFHASQSDIETAAETMGSTTNVATASDPMAKRDTTSTTRSTKTALAKGPGRKPRAGRQTAQADDRNRTTTTTTRKRRQSQTGKPANLASSDLHERSPQRASCHDEAATGNDSAMHLKLAPLQVQAQRHPAQNVGQLFVHEFMGNVNLRVRACALARRVCHEIKGGPEPDEGVPDLVRRCRNGQVTEEDLERLGQWIFARCLHMPQDKDGAYAREADLSLSHWIHEANARGIGIKTEAPHDIEPGPRVPDRASELCDSRQEQSSRDHKPTVLWPKADTGAPIRRHRRSVVGATDRHVNDAKRSTRMNAGATKLRPNMGSTSRNNARPKRPTSASGSSSNNGSENDSRGCKTPELDRDDDDDVVKTEDGAPRGDDLCGPLHELALRHKAIEKEIARPRADIRRSVPLGDWTPTLVSDYLARPMRSCMYWADPYLYEVVRRRRPPSTARLGFVPSDLYLIRWSPLDQVEQSFQQQYRRACEFIQRAAAKQQHGVVSTAQLAAAPRVQYGARRYDDTAELKGGAPLCAIATGLCFAADKNVADAVEAGFVLPSMYAMKANDGGKGKVGEKDSRRKCDADHGATDGNETESNENGPGQCAPSYHCNPILHPAVYTWCDSTSLARNPTYAAAVGTFDRAVTKLLGQALSAFWARVARKLASMEELTSRRERRYICMHLRLCIDGELHRSGLRRWYVKRLAADDHGASGTAAVTATDSASAKQQTAELSAKTPNARAPVPTNSVPFATAIKEETPPKRYAGRHELDCPPAPPEPPFWSTLLNASRLVMRDERDEFLAELNRRRATEQSAIEKRLPEGVVGLAIKAAILGSLPAPQDDTPDPRWVEARWRAERSKAGLPHDRASIERVRQFVARFPHMRPWLGDATARSAPSAAATVEQDLPRDAAEIRADVERTALDWYHGATTIELEPDHVLADPARLLSMWQEADAADACRGDPMPDVVRARDLVALFYASWLRHERPILPVYVADTRPPHRDPNWSWPGEGKECLAPRVVEVEYELEAPEAETLSQAEHSADGNDSGRSATDGSSSGRRPLGQLSQAIVGLGALSLYAACAARDGRLLPEGTRPRPRAPPRAPDMSTCPEKAEPTRDERHLYVADIDCGSDSDFDHDQGHARSLLPKSRTKAAAALDRINTSADLGSFRSWSDAANSRADAITPEAIASAARKLMAEGPSHDKANVQAARVDQFACQHSETTNLLHAAGYTEHVMTRLPNQDVDALAFSRADGGHSSDSDNDNNDSDDNGSNDYDAGRHAEQDEHEEDDHASDTCNRAGTVNDRQHALPRQTSTQGQSNDTSMTNRGHRQRDNGYRNGHMRGFALIEEDDPGESDDHDDTSESDANKDNDCSNSDKVTNEDDEGDDGDTDGTRPRRRVAYRRGKRHTRANSRKRRRTNSNARDDLAQSHAGCSPRLLAMRKDKDQACTHHPHDRRQLGVVVNPLLSECGDDMALGREAPTGTQDQDGVWSAVGPLPRLRSRSAITTATTTTSDTPHKRRRFQNEPDYV